MMPMDDLRKRIASNAFLILGRAGLDFTPPPGVRIEDAQSCMMALGGSSANIAAGICRLGGKAELVTCVSDDAIGRFCLNQLAAYGIGSNHVRAVGGEFRNSLAVYETRNDNTQSIIYRNGAADFEMSIEDVEAVNYSSFGALIAAGTIFAAEPSRSASFRAFELARASNVPIIFDVDYRPYSWPSAAIAEEVLSRAGAMADVIVANDDEFGFMAGAYDKGLAKAHALSDETAAIVIYKMGAKGALTFYQGKIIQTGIYSVEALKPTGAGDSFMAGFMTGLAQGMEIEAAVLRGSACASIVVSRPGCAPAMPTPGELSDFLEPRSPSAAT